MSNKVLFEECDKEENVAVNGLWDTVVLLEMIVTVQHI
jgi:hypothetical protein